MRVPIDLFADLQLSNGQENVSIKAQGSRIYVVFPTLRQGMRTIRNLLNQRGWVAQLENLNSTLVNLGLSLYFRVGPISAPVVGVEAHRKAIPALKDLLRRYTVLRGE